MNKKEVAEQEVPSPEIEETEELPDESQMEDIEEYVEQVALKALQNDYEALNDRYLRVVAEYDNFRKRSTKEKESIYPEGVAATVASFLPLVDNFTRALEVECSDESYKKGIELTYNSLTDILTRLKVEQYAEAGDLFDPKLHNAVMHYEDEAVEVSTVAEVFQKGYRIGDRILRFAMVKVAN